MKKITMVGLGYIGLPTAAILARSGANVVGVDVNEKVVESLNSGRVHIVEPDLDEIVHEAVKSGRLKAVTRPEASDAFIIAVPTPFKDGNTADLSFIETAARSIAPVLKKGDLVILESTSPVGTTEKLARMLGEARDDLAFAREGMEAPDVHIAYCPERVLPGRIILELVENDRIIGGITPACTEKAVRLYRIFVRGECLKTNSRTAEMVKLTENAFRDVNIAFANELSMISERLDINVWDLVRLANHHPRVNILKPGPGVGGHCIAVDPWFIVESAPEQARLIRTAREVNDGKPRFVLERVAEAVRGFERPVIACLGLAYKANIDDLRESPALAITRELAASMDAAVLVVEPHIEGLPASLDNMENVRLTSYEEALKEANVILLLVDHDVFSIRPDPEQVRDKVIIDTRGAWN